MEEIAQADSDKEDTFDLFQLEEYKNISTSHYESVKQVSDFFRNYLLILAAPAFIFTLISGKSGELDEFLKGSKHYIYYDVVFFYFAIVAIIGFFIFLYAVNLRHDAMLYAKSVNRVRRYFYEKSNLEVSDYEKYLSLPITSTKPRYTEKTFFVPLLMVFTVINCGFLLAGFYLKKLNSKFFGEWWFPFDLPYFDLPINSYSIITVLLLFGGLHWIAYLQLSRRRENSYLRYYSFGIDIDGVLNNQTEQFVDYLFLLTGKKINKSRIKEIPVSLNRDLGISDEDEKLVFNTKEYWQGLELKPKADKRINDIQRKFGYKITFFTYRDFPQYPTIEEDKEAIKAKIIERGYIPLKDGELQQITAQWLKEKNILNEKEANYIIVKNPLTKIWFQVSSFFVAYKRVVIERGNPFISDTRFFNNYRKEILNQNRFQFSKLKGFRFFIEDFPENAIKLSALCDYVFMFDEPYNKKENYNFPKNIIRVESWEDIYRHLKTLS
jgi:uncharacterized HAD superfamily protein